MSATATKTGTTLRTKEFHFPLTVDWLGERRVAAAVEGKPTIEITPPPVFRGTDPATWSPEDFFVAAAASCLAVTFTGLATRAGLAYTALRIDADGVAGTRDDGRFGFTRLLLRLELETAPADEAQARELAEEAERTCLVSASLDLPVEATIVVRPPSLAPNSQHSIAAVASRHSLARRRMVSVDRRGRRGRCRPPSGGSLFLHPRRVEDPEDGGEHASSAAATRALDALDRAGLRR
jgi:organic hydroperoxide reductase OsmC/OhrA